MQAVTPLGPDAWRMPFAVYLFETEGLVSFIRERWDAKDGVPGLSEAAAFLSANIADELESLARAARDLHLKAAFEGGADSERSALLSEAQELLSELHLACEFVLDDGVEDADDHALAVISARSQSDSTLATTVQALKDYAGLSERLLSKLELLSSFDPKFIERAKLVAARLAEMGLGSGRPASAYIEQRNRIMALLSERVERVRAAAQFVFRKHPKIAREARSAYQRRKRSEAKRRKVSAPE
jgi:chorismate mutase